MRTARVAAMAGILLAAGCVQVEQLLVVNRTGSGSYELRYALAEETVDQIKAMFLLKDQVGIGPAATVALAGDDERVRAFFDPDEAKLRRILQAYASYGVTVERLTVETRRGIREVRLKANVNRLSTLAASDLFPEYGFSLRKTQEGNIEFSRKPPKAGEDDPFDVTDPDVMKQLAPFLGGFRVVTKVQVPGEILTSNANSASRYTGAWTYDYDKNANAVLRLQREPLQILFDGRGVELPEIRQYAAAAPARKQPAAAKPAPRGNPQPAP
jgi:hypothetical protein